MYTRLFIIAVYLFSYPLPVLAGCMGSGSIQFCDDDSGNSYTVQRIGSMTFTNGNNYQTGSSWSQTTHNIGNLTFHDGQSNGNNWNMTQQQVGNYQFVSGQDSKGHSFNYTCNQSGCN